MLITVNDRNGRIADAWRMVMRAGVKPWHSRCGCNLPAPTSSRLARVTRAKQRYSSASAIPGKIKLRSMRKQALLLRRVTRVANQPRLSAKT